MKIVRSRYLPLRGFDAINLCGVLFVHQGVYLSGELINHERIHTAQMRELCFVLFYVLYLAEWLVRELPVAPAALCMAALSGCRKSHTS